MTTPSTTPVTRLAYTRAFVDWDSTTADGPIRFVGATEGEKPDGINLRMSGGRLDRYRANPIFGYGHRYHGRDSLPIGRSEKTEVDKNNRLMFDILFDRDDAFAAEVERKYRNKFMNAVSIGFSVIEWEDPKTQNYWAGGTAVDWELYELSAVPLPMDANAVVDSGRDWNSGLAIEPELLDAVRGLLGRLDAPAIASLRQLLDGAARPSRDPVDVDPGTPPAPTADERSGMRLATARRRLQLLGRP